MSKSSILLLTSVILYLVSCSEENNTQETTERNLNQTKDEYIKTIEELNKDFFKNYDTIEKVVLNKIKSDGADYFIENNCFEILAKFESTLALFCEISEKLNVDNTGGLLTSYLHLNDLENVKKQYDLMQDDENALIAHYP